MTIPGTGYVALPVGTAVTGRIVAAKPAGRLSGAAELSIELVSVKVATDTGPQDKALVTQTLSSAANGREANTAAKTGGGAALGAVVGAVAGGGKGAGIGAASGGVLGLGANALTHGQEIDLKPEQLIQFKTGEPLDVTITTQAGRQIAAQGAAGAGLATRMTAGL